jgi:hypothetical protein
VSGENFNPQNTSCIPAVKIFAFLELEQISSFMDGNELVLCPTNKFQNHVTPAQAGVQQSCVWIPACAGMTNWLQAIIAGNYL